MCSEDFVTGSLSAHFVKKNVSSLALLGAA